MTAWRIDDDNSRKYRVVLHLHGIDHCMSVSDAMSLLRTAPKMAGKWPPAPGPGCGAMRADLNDRIVAVVFGALNVDGTHEWAAYDPSPKVGSMSAGPIKRGSAATLAEAQHAADAALRAAGWLLEEG